MKVVCIACRAKLQVEPHAFGCPATRRSVSDKELAEILIKKGVIK
jgi:hypothetical protein